MTERCVDANVAAKWALTMESDHDRALALLYDSIASGITLIAPPLFPVELDSIIRKRVHNGSLTAEQGRQTFVILDAIPVEILTPEGLRLRARSIAEQFNQRFVYDAYFAALADLRGCELWTADTRFHRVVKNDLPFVKHIADYPNS